MKTPFLSIQNLGLNYGETSILSNCNLELNQGQLGCILGKSGSGKTSLLRAIAGFEEINNGKIEIDKLILAKQTQLISPQHREIGFVFQDYMLFPHLNIYQNICLGIKQLPKTKQKKIIKELAKIFEITPYLEKYSHQISGGQRQRAAIARSLAPNPKILLLDEPFSNLDTELRERFCTELKNIFKTKKITVLLVTHSPKEAMLMSDCLGVLDKGHLLQWDTPRKLYQKPSHQLVANILGDASFIRIDNLQKLSETQKQDALIIDALDIEKEDPNHVVFLRPNDIQINQNSSLKGVINSASFLGGHIKLEINCSELDVILKTNSVNLEYSFNINQEVGIQIKITKEQLIV